MSRFLRPTLFLLTPLLLAAGALAAITFAPRADAVRCLATFGESAPEDLTSLTDLPDGLVLLDDAAQYGVTRAFVRRARPKGEHPTMLFVHGAVKEGLKDGRILQAIEAFWCAGFTVVAPEIPSLIDATADTGDEVRLGRLVDAIAAGKVPGADGRRIGVVGISVGGAVALHVCAAARARGLLGVRAILAIGAPDDIRTLAPAWFACEDPAKQSDGTLEWKRRDAAAFARSFIVRATLSKRLGTHEDIKRLLTWLDEKHLPRKKPPPLETEAARELATFLQAAPVERAKARESLLRDAWGHLGGLSPASWDAELIALRGVPVFLMHGHGDPLVPLEEVEALRKRLATRTLVSVLRSRLVGHTSVGEAGLGHRVEHVVFMDDFFDAIAR